MKLVFATNNPNKLKEVKEILPELIGGTEKHGYKVSYDEMISVLFEAIKEFIYQSLPETPEPETP